MYDYNPFIEAIEKYEKNNDSLDPKNLQGLKEDLEQIPICPSKKVEKSKENLLEFLDSLIDLFLRSGGTMPDGDKRVLDLELVGKIADLLGKIDVELKEEKEAAADDDDEVF